MKKRSAYGMPPVETRQEFERNIFLVLEDFTRKMDSDDKDMKANAYWATYPHLKRIKKLPNGRIDLVTINESIRNQGNMFNWMRFMDRPKRTEPEKGEGEAENGGEE